MRVLYRSLMICTVLAYPIAHASALEPSKSLKALIKAANAEGSLNLSWGQSVVGGTAGAKQAEQRMNALFGTKIKINFVPGPSMARSAHQLTLEYKAGKKASTDVYIGWAAPLAYPLQQDVFQSVDWRALLPERIRPGTVEANGRLLRLGTTSPVIVYNTQRAPMKPTSLADLLRPEWKGKVATTPYIAGYDILSANDAWGLEKTKNFLGRLSPQLGGLIRCGAEVERVASGEYAALAMDCIAGNTITWQKRGAPVAYVIPSDAAEIHYYYVTVTKNATYPNAAKLFAVFMLTQEGQKLNWDTWKMDLDSFPGSHSGQDLAKLNKEGVRPIVVTMDWWQHHPEIQKSQRELMRLVRQKK